MLLLNSQQHCVSYRIDSINSVVEFCWKMFLDVIREGGLLVRHLLAEFNLTFKKCERETYWPIRQRLARMKKKKLAGKVYNSLYVVIKFNNYSNLTITYSSFL